MIYLHLIYPNIQCFTAANYSDIVVTAGIIESIQNPKAKTLEDFKAKTSGANESPIKTFLKTQSNMTAIKIGADSNENLRTIFGNQVESLFEEAER